MRWLSHLPNSSATQMSRALLQYWRRNPNYLSRILREQVGRHQVTTISPLYSLWDSSSLAFRTRYMKDTYSMDSWSQSQIRRSKARWNRGSIPSIICLPRNPSSFLWWQLAEIQEGWVIKGNQLFLFWNWSSAESTTNSSVEKRQLKTCKKSILTSW